MGLGGTLLDQATTMAASALNRALEADPAARDILLEELAAPVAITLVPFGATLTLARSGDRLALKQGPSGPGTDTHITATPLALLALAGGDTSGLDQGLITVEGDSERVRHLAHRLHALAPDWEAFLARTLGDVPAHVIARRLRDALRWSQQARASVHANIEDYLHEESGLVPGRHEAEARFSDIDALESRVKALENRLNNLAPEEDH
ncbi:SCP2 sterol-binding domain-containing protein [uncultured Halovibrio sp.]|uniref:ubiquinone biosynthesis accessory factor UbiJ n=1 Tax=uncultured Halovibrio sp. TaxID=985049 RepID=UPI0025FBA1B0|nr:SCP2 sterol-binding domain-containing protein [uncultured Halovibrio sp.]